MVLANREKASPIPMLGEYIKGATIDFVVEAEAGNLQALIDQIVSVNLKMYDNDDHEYTFVRTILTPTSDIPFGYRFFIADSTPVVVGEYNLLLTITYTGARTEKRRMGKIKVTEQ